MVDAPPIGDTDLAAVGAILAEPARAKVLLALGDGRLLAASVLAEEAGVAPSTASHHLGRLLDAGLVTVTVRGRHRYYRLSGPAVGELIEAVARVAPAQPVTSLRQGTRAHAVRYARHCYDHLAGRLGVAVAESLDGHGFLETDADASSYTVTSAGAARLAGLGVDVHTGDTGRCCLDWTEQRHHLAGAVGRGLLARFLELGWLVPSPKGRALRLTDAGRAGFHERFDFAAPLDAA
jgi:DNA-binding transcriptional ArsR family regulator